MHHAVELRHLRTFVAVAEELHFTRAAQRLHLTQQALSVQLRQLEDALGTQLVHRTTRKVKLTEAGEVLLARVVPVLSDLSVAWEDTRRAGSGKAGFLKLCYTPTVAHESLPRLVQAMHEYAPEVRLRTCEMWQAEGVAAVQAGRFDIGFARCPVLDGALESTVIREEPVGIFLGTGHRLSGGAAVRIEDLSSEKLMIWPRELSPNYYDLVVDFLRRHGFAGPVLELENLSHAIFIGDTVARMEVAACRAFSIGFATEWNPLPEGFVWLPLVPAPAIPLDMFWKPGPGAVVGTFVRLAREVAQAEEWLASECSPDHPRRAGTVQPVTG